LRENRGKAGKRLTLLELVLARMTCNIKILVREREREKERKRERERERERQINRKDK